ncbi:MAG: CatA-like O-acetyltransferase, partial [Anaerolineales bacterium]
FYPFMKQHGFSINVGIVYLNARAANAIPEFRYRIREGEVVEHEIIHPATTILTKEGLFNFCTFDYIDDFPTFETRAKKMIAETRQDPALNIKPGQDDLMYTTAIPWVRLPNLCIRCITIQPIRYPGSRGGSFLRLAIAC